MTKKATRGRPKKAPTQQVALRLPLDLIAAIDEKAAKAGILERSTAIRVALLAWVAA